MHTNIDIDANLVREAQELGGYKTKKDAVNEALSEFVRLRKQKKIIEIFGTIDYDPNYDYKAERSR